MQSAPAVSHRSFDSSCKMWLLKDNDGNLTYLKPNEILTVGRKRGNIVLENDASISRVHAEIVVRPKQQVQQIVDRMDPLSTCTISDPGSKYGNFVINHRDSPELKISQDGYALCHADKIRFGLQNSVYTAYYIPIISTTTGMDEDEKNDLRKILEAIDGKLVYVWTDLCTHITIAKSTISEKLSCSLAVGMPIVAIDYWKAVLKAFMKNEQLPDPDTYATKIDAKMSHIDGVSFRPNPKRKTSLQNLIFLHFESQQYAVYSRMIKLAGGESYVYGKQPEYIRDVCADNVIVVQYVESSTTQATGTGDANYENVCEKLGKSRRRAIPETEITLAILHCSTEKYCNPKFDFATLMKPRQSRAASSGSKVLAVDTQDVDESQRKAKITCVKESSELSSFWESQSDEIFRSKTNVCIPESGDSGARSVSYEYQSCSGDSGSKEPSRESSDRCLTDSMKRGREDVDDDDDDDDNNDNGDKKKQRLTLQKRCGKKKSIANDEDDCFVGKVVKEETNEKNRTKGDSASSSSVSVEKPSRISETTVSKSTKSLTLAQRAQSFRADSHESRNERVGAHEISPSELSASVREAPIFCVPSNEPKEKAPAKKMDQDEILRKRKINESEMFVTCDINENERKRGKSEANSGKAPQKVEATKRPKENINEETAWKNTVEKSKDLFVESFEKSRRQDKTTFSLLRINNSIESGDFDEKKLKKSFNKRYNMIPVERINMNDFQDVHSWSVKAIEKTIKREEASFDDEEEPPASRKVSPDSKIKVNKVLRI